MGLTSALASLADEFEADLDEVVDLIARRLLAEDTTRTHLVAETQTAVRSAVRGILRDAAARMRNGGGLPAEAPEDVVRLAQLWARSGGDLATVVDAHAVAQEVFWERVSEVSERVAVDPRVRWEMIKEARTRLAGYTHNLTELFRQAYDRELGMAASLVGGRRVAAVRRVLAGEPIDATELGYELDHDHVALIADSRAANMLPSLAARARRDLLRVAVPGGLMWAWIGGKAPLRSRELDELVVWLRGRGRIAIGEPASGIIGFRSSHQMALETWNVGNGSAEGATRFADVALPAALLRDEALAELFIERELGGLAAQTARETALRRTLTIYLENRESVSTTAALVGHDRKTIQRRVASAEALLPRKLAERSAEIRIALRLLEARTAGP